MTCGCPPPVSCSTSAALRPKGACSDPFYSTPTWDACKPGGYMQEEWVCYNHRWYYSMANDNTMNPVDRTVWSGPYTMNDVLSIISAGCCTDRNPLALTCSNLMGLNLACIPVA